MRHFLVFGSHPRLSLAEFLAFKYPTMGDPSGRPYAGRDKSRPYPPIVIGSAAIVEDPLWDGKRLMETLGGTVKLGDIIATIPTSEVTPDRLTSPPLAPPLLNKERGKGGEVRSEVNFGFTIFGSKKFSKLPIEFKRALKSRGIASRWVTGKSGSEIAPAAVAKLKLTTEGLDLCLFVQGEMVYVGRTTHVQDADAWSLRDYGRPARDPHAGMLSPKLARMMVNVVSLPLTKGEGREGVLLDPFCGSGTILMEAALAIPNARIIGSDISAEQISNTQKNISWLIAHQILQQSDARRLDTFVMDARHLSQKLTRGSIDAVVTEGYLGPPLRGNESLATLEKNAREITELWRDTLRELHPLLTLHARLVCIWPAFKTSGGIVRVNLESEISTLGYALCDPFEGWEVPPGPLLYSRPGQHVMRRIVLLKRTPTPSL